MILNGDALEMLKALPSESVQCCVTSPPYYALRDYCVSGQIGLEETPDAYISRLVDVFREVRRVLRNDGTLWLNIGDSYANDAPRRNNNGVGSYTMGWPGQKYETLNKAAGINLPRVRTGLKPKDLIGIPWMLAFALRADGWFLRQDIIWAKNNPMPESVRDRCTKSHEYIFLLSKSKTYYYDADAIREEMVTDGKGGLWGANRGPNATWAHDETHIGAHGTPLWRGDRSVNDKGRNARSVWTINTRPYKEAHFATFPPEIPRRCIAAGTKEGDTVLDPFGGSGTTGEVAQRMGRKYILIELNPEYVKLIEKRLSSAHPLFGGEQ